MKNTKQSIGRPPTEECKSCFGKGYYYNDDDDWRDPDGGVSVRRCPDDECVHGKEWEETKNREEQEAEERWVRNGGRLPGQNVKENKMNITKEYLAKVIKEELEAIQADVIEIQDAIERYKKNPTIEIQGAIERYKKDPAAWNLAKKDYMGMAKGDDAWGMRQTHYPDWRDDDFQTVINALSDIDAQALWDL
jgi:hypothetical protein